MYSHIQTYGRQFKFHVQSNLCLHCIFTLCILFFEKHGHIHNNGLSQTMRRPCSCCVWSNDFVYTVASSIYMQCRLFFLCTTCVHAFWMRRRSKQTHIGMSSRIARSLPRPPIPTHGPCLIRLRIASSYPVNASRILVPHMLAETTSFVYDCMLLFGVLVHRQHGLLLHVPENTCLRSPNLLPSMLCMCATSLPCAGNSSPYRTSVCT